MKCLMKVAGVLAFAVCLLPILTAQNEEYNRTFQDFDTNGDELIERQEFTRVFMANYTNDWDTKDNPGLDDEDFFTMTYAMLDTDDDDLLDDVEWNFGRERYFGAFTTDNFHLYDLNDDKMISYAEYQKALHNTNYYMLWDMDRDRYINKYEMAEAVFNAWDVNDNNSINKSEFYRFDVYYSDI